MRVARLAWIVLTIALSTGCNRAFYRHWADNEVYTLIDHRAKMVNGQLDDYSIRPNTESRMFEPGNPDKPPMPLDDPASHRFMKCVDHKKGSNFWGCYGTTPYRDNPCWLKNVSANSEGALVLDRGTAMQMALTNSREYQTELENIYLSALTVTYERFRFDTQFFGSNDLEYESLGAGLGGGAAKSYLTNDTDVILRKLFATGGELTVNAANSLMWQFAGPDNYSGSTLLDFTLVQPLLRGAGRAVVLESLTDSERALLVQIRHMERYRRGFYSQIIAGVGGGTGIYDLLRQQVQIRNQVQNVVALRDTLEKFEALYRTSQISLFQVQQNQLNLYRAQMSLLNARNTYENASDRYKIQLGLPPSLPVTISDPMLAQFDLIDSKMTEAQDRVIQLISEIRDPESPQTLLDAISQLTEVNEICLAQVETVRDDIKKTRKRDALQTRTTATVGRTSGIQIGRRRSVGRECQKTGRAFRIDPKLFRSRLA